ncbi:hypothetical protein RRU94_17560 [Domibacillus sp. DTU_2020_1001157_1_SI_ALB_TIR_016]|uniref:hypothetical protein n=1 Tax=Domibacillus sp. DTU_2020_1001157_1_SI_ALB_TIR_016 TaxID=3077789 RepID=UPI0028E57705|nr:hypothetical protein [Domibacillus sp. DTU_2020_1001157_1_SI_ALB_TIR_016]WNS79353.1 hypothetical protein RRU94_17560 [Domibacillus sp. DTU_2020_1001157_1_SI_ALB_TIR_016]
MFSIILKPGKAPATKEDIQKILDTLFENGIKSSKSSSSTPRLFKEGHNEAKDERFKLEEH